MPTETGFGRSFTKRGLQLLPIICNAFCNISYVIVKYLCNETELTNHCNKHSRYN